jgi:catechol 2,3-dioxygenase-like lactoylglutathione lyase family enzyme
MNFHHVNLGVPTGGIEAQERFLVDLLGYRVVEVDEAMKARGVHWFEADDGSQVHLSEDPDHRPADRAHVAVEFGDELDRVGSRLRDAGWEFTDGGGLGARVLFLRDPSGNRWELRGVPAA